MWLWRRWWWWLFSCRHVASTTAWVFFVSACTRSAIWWRAVIGINTCSTSTCLRLISGVLTSTRTWLSECLWSIMLILRVTLWSTSLSAVSICFIDVEYRYFTVVLGRYYVGQSDSTQPASGAVVTQLASWVGSNQVRQRDHSKNSTRQKSGQFAVSGEVLSMFRTSGLTENWRFFGQLSWVELSRDHNYSGHYSKFWNRTPHFLLVQLSQTPACIWGPAGIQGPASIGIGTVTWD